YYALLLDRHEVLFAEGAATESFRPGPTAIAHYSAEHRAQIFGLYPGLANDPEQALGPIARPAPRARAIREHLRAMLCEDTASSVQAKPSAQISPELTKT
ncbi:MAG: hypothetical protein AAGB15_14465, partial [Pseudomonadota bacterium]